MTAARRGLALLLVVGVLGILAALSAAFVTLARLERRASLQRLHASKALLLARSGIEDALARLAAGQDPDLQENRYAGEDYDGDGVLTAGVETTEQVYQPASLEGNAACPLRHALRPSFFVNDGTGLGALPELLGSDGRQRGHSGRLSGDARETFTTRVENLNGRIHINGGNLSAGACTDTSNDGPNGFLVRMLDNLDLVVTGTSDLGLALVGARPEGGYRSLRDLEAVLGAEYPLLSPFLTVHAWVDPQVLKPQPVNARPNRWLDVDATYQAGAGASSGSGTQADPWEASFGPAMANPTGGMGGAEKDYTVYTYSWERDYLYAWRQLRLGPGSLEPRAPVSVHAAPREVLASVFLGLRGTYLEVWDGHAGYDSGFGFGNAEAAWYVYPSRKTEETPWHRTRMAHGTGYGPGATGSGGASRPWYGPEAYATPALAQPLFSVEPLGRLKETPPVSLAQALAIADAIRQRISQTGPFRTWAEFQAFVDLLPAWEDLDGNGVLDGPLYNVPTELDSATMGDELVPRKRHQREDADSDGSLDRQTFGVLAGDWATGISWKSLPADPAGVPGLSFLQKDVLKAMANPNTDLNDFNPDANLYKETDKTDVVGIEADPGSYAHTTELLLEDTGPYRIASLGRVTAPGSRLLASSEVTAETRPFNVFRHSTQEDFMEDFRASGDISGTFSGPVPPYPLSGGQALLSYPEPQTVAGAPWCGGGYDGQVGLGLIGSPTGIAGERLRGDLFDTLDAGGTGDASVPDAWGPFHTPLTGAGPGVGTLFPDGIYSERDASLKFDMAGNFDEMPYSNELLGLLAPETYAFYIAGWVKPNWLPEASPRAHALISLSPGETVPVPPSTDADGNPIAWTQYGLREDRLPSSNLIRSTPCGLYFVPARNNLWLDAPQVYSHSGLSAKGQGWPVRSLLWGTMHAMYAGESLHRRGQGYPEVAGMSASRAATFPIGRMEGRRWTHLGVLGKTGSEDADGNRPPSCALLVGRKRAAVNGSDTAVGSAVYGGMGRYVRAIAVNHGDGTPNHLRFGEIAGMHNMNYVADATYANVRAGGTVQPNLEASYGPLLSGYESFLKGPLGPATLGRYYKEGDYLGTGYATFTSPKLPQGVRPLRVTWTEIPCELWFDKLTNGTADASPDGWMDTLANDQFGPGGAPVPDGLRDVRIDLEVWDDRGPPGPAGDVLLGTFSRPEVSNALAASTGRVYYKALFVNDWDDDTRSNEPLDVTPFLDDVTFLLLPAGGPVLLSWTEGSD